ncbi:MAG: six-hairpin glycosidase [Muribaculaceae bacterium]|nr:six-hairpin glycosidase [Muribaculaceae bacterium]
MKKLLFILVVIVFYVFPAYSKKKTESPSVPVHPAYLTTPRGIEDTKRLIGEEQWAQEVFSNLKKKTDKYADMDPEWLTSRLQMYWNSHATDVFINGEFYEKAGGEKSPVPTVTFTGSRGHGTDYVRPRLEDVTPYDEDPRGKYLAAKSDGKMEWVPLSKTGRIIESINNEILGIARDAAFLYAVTGEEKYARLADSVFDTYMKGIYYRNVPIDLNNGHQQTLVGMTSFEVIHEDALDALVPLYDFLYEYIRAQRPDDLHIYETAFKKWADNLIDKGVPHNNWNLMQARYIVNIALILGDDAYYSDCKGKQYYVDYVKNRNSIRQWSLKELADYGFDPCNGIWSECPGYSTGVVVNDYASFIQLFDRNLATDLAEEIPVVGKAVMALPQYLFPNMIMVGFGDTHPGPIKIEPIENMIRNAQANGKREDEIKFTRLLKTLRPDATLSAGTQKPRVAVNSFYADKPLEIDSTVPAGVIDDYVSALFYAPNVSWVVQRSGMQPSSLMVSLNGSEGNHMHSNGINLELYGKGFTLGPDAGIGKTLYQGLDYLEYYSQFPAHNTVCVNGISSYPVMKSHHPFKLRSHYPENESNFYSPVSYTDIEFVEPETFALQNRFTGIVTVDSVSGYYVDIFRSHIPEGGDKTHDYFYHNLGQRMKITGAEGENLDLQPTEELAFAGAHLFAYSYLYDKKSQETEKDIKTVFTIDMPDSTQIDMTMWMKGEKDRKIFKALSPMTEGLSRTAGMPYNISEQPTLTFVARQYGEALSRPFVAIYEPSSTMEPGTIMNVEFPELKIGASEDVAIQVNHKNGLQDLIIYSSDTSRKSGLEGVESDASYLFVRKGDAGVERIFLGNVTDAQIEDITLKAQVPVDLLLEKSGDSWHYRTTGDATLKIGDSNHSLHSTSQYTTYRSL